MALSRDDPQLPFQGCEGLLPVLTRFLEGFAGEAAQGNRSEAGADAAAVVRFLLLPAVLLLLLSEVLRQALGVFGLQAIEDRLQGPAADIPQKSLQLLLELECGPRSNTLPEKCHHHPCHLLAHLLSNATKFFVDFLKILGDQCCQQKAEQIRILHGRRPFLENRVVVVLRFLAKSASFFNITCCPNVSLNLWVLTNLPFSPHFARMRRLHPPKGRCPMQTHDLDKGSFFSSR